VRTSRIRLSTPLANPDIWLHRKRDNLEQYVNRGGLVKVAFFGGQTYPTYDPCMS
jgi:hypothetical protein